MNRMTAAIAIALSAISFSPAEAQAPNLQFQTPLNYRFSVQPKSHVFFYNRNRHHAWRHRHHHRQALPVLAGPAVIYQNGEIGIPPQIITGSIPSPSVQPVVYRIGSTGGCDRQQVHVPGSKGRTAVNVWRC